jgi:hypothetical protein
MKLTNNRIGLQDIRLKIFAFASRKTTFRNTLTTGKSLTNKKIRLMNNMKVMKIKQHQLLLSSFRSYEIGHLSQTKWFWVLNAEALTSQGHIFPFAHESKPSDLFLLLHSNPFR